MAAEGALHQAPVPGTAAACDSGYRLVPVGMTLAPRAGAMWELCLSCEIFIFKTLVLEIETSMFQALERMQSSLLLQLGPEKKEGLTRFLFLNPKYSILYPHMVHTERLRYEKYVAFGTLKTLTLFLQDF